MAINQQELSNDLSGYIIKAKGSIAQRDFLSWFIPWSLNILKWLRNNCDVGDEFAQIKKVFDEIRDSLEISGDLVIIPPIIPQRINEILFLVQEIPKPKDPETSTPNGEPPGKGIAAPERPKEYSQIINALKQFHTAQKKVSSSRKGKAPFIISDEYDVQDLLYSGLRLYFPNIEHEDPAPKVAGESSRVDLVLKGFGIIIEVKHCRKNHNEKKIAGELKQDIESYHSHPECNHLIAFIYDPDGLIEDPDKIIRDLSGVMKKGDSEFSVVVVISPK
jgi:hypothetical protein